QQVATAQAYSPDAGDRQAADRGDPLVGISHAKPQLLDESGIGRLVIGHTGCGHLGGKTGAERLVVGDVVGGWSLAREESIDVPRELLGALVSHRPAPGSRPCAARGTAAPWRCRG